jgi:uncharacterized protein (DUF302 family)
MQLGYTCETNKSFDEVVAQIQDRTAARGFRVLFVHDIQGNLAEKGLGRTPFKIIEICNSKFAHTVLDINEDVGLFMPCKINVYTKGGKTIISAMRPAMISEFFASKELKEAADEVDAIVRSIVDEVKQS